MKRPLVLVITCVLCFSSLHTRPTAYAQDQTKAPGGEKIKTLLLRSIGWVVEWQGPEGTAQAGLTYEARGDKVVVGIEHLGETSVYCERDVTITADGFAHDGCRDRDVRFRFDPTDPAVPFIGKGALGIEYKLRAEWLP